MIRRILRISAWVIGSLLGLCIAAYGIAVAINWRDRAPSEAANRLTKAYRERPPIADQDNAFVYMMGFAVAPGENPRTIGAQRVAWMQTAAATTQDAQGDPLADPPDIRERRDPTIKQFVDACGPRGSDCDDAFLAGGDVFERWIASEQWLLERYQALIAHGGWQETVPFDVRLPMPSYSLVADGQRLLLLHARELARRGDHAAVRNLLADDARFWREALKSSDTLLSKMMALALLRRHFRLGNLVLREFAPSDALLAMPAQWDAGITEAERSLRRCLVGEWLFTAEQLRQGRAEYWDDYSPELWQRFLNRALAPLYQQQDTSNATAAIYEAQAPFLDAPLADYESALRRMSATIEQVREEESSLNSPYNFAGRFAVGEGSFDFTSYGRRVNDIEGIRRAAVTAVRLRAQRVELENIGSALANAPLRNPYNDQPFTWDAERRAILFVGLVPGEYGEHPFRY